ncbi:MAG: hypothetical protein WAQ25_03855 [Candidatus Saccharimonas sp.]
MAFNTCPILPRHSPTSEMIYHGQVADQPAVYDFRPKSLISHAAARSYWAQLSLCPETALSAADATDFLHEGESYFVTQHGAILVAVRGLRDTCLHTRFTQDYADFMQQQHAA